jgi:hypothetical protein
MDLGGRSLFVDSDLICVLHRSSKSPCAMFLNTVLDPGCTRAWL